jgi:hypothetical protein
VNGVGVGIIVEVGIIGIVEEGSAARVKVGIVGDKVGVERAYVIEKRVIVEVWYFRDKLSFKNELNKRSKFIANSGFSSFFLLSLLSLFSLFFLW